MLTSIIIDLISPNSGPRILNICVAPLENLNATCLLDRTDPAFFVSRVRVIFPLVPFKVTKTWKEKGNNSSDIKIKKSKRYLHY